MNRNTSIISKRKAIWDHMGFGYRNEPNRLYKNHWISCGCSCCRYASMLQKKRIRDNRHESKIRLKIENYEND